MAFRVVVVVVVAVGIGWRGWTSLVSPPDEKRESERAHSDGDPIDAALGVFRGVSQTPSCIPPFFFFFFFSSFIFYIFIYTYIFPSMSTQRIAAPEKLFFCLTVCVIIKSSGSFLHETFSSIPAHSRLKKKGIIIT
jgi:hypothetical protein